LKEFPKEYKNNFSQTQHDASQRVHAVRGNAMCLINIFKWSGMHKHIDMYSRSPGRSPFEMVLADSWYVSCNLSKALAAPVWSSSVGKNCLWTVRLEMNPTKENR